MDRLAPNAVLPAFDDNCLPRQGTFVVHDDDGEIIGCCGLTAALIVRGQAGTCSREWTTSVLEGRPDSEAARLFAGALDLDPTYCLGFIRGWDWGPKSDDEFSFDFAAFDGEGEGDKELYRLGYLDGAAAWFAARTLYLEG